MNNLSPHAVTVSRGTDPALAPALAQLFLQEVTPAYISHGEVQLGRARDFSRWADNLPMILESELADSLAGGGNSSPEVVVAVARIAGELAGFALVRLVHEPTHYAVLEDVVVSAMFRGKGVGKHIVLWAENEARRLGAQRLFLESGLQNQAAHEFFHKLGFTECSVVMTKDLS
jgi:GNAT superfamily N-acetyltransferase